MKTIATSFRCMTTWVGSLFLLCGANNAHALSCWANNSTLVMNMTAPKTLVIPKNTPNGYALYESSQKMPTGAARFECDQAGAWGYVNERGTTPSDTEPHPIGNTGLGWRMSYGKTFAPAYPKGSLNAGAYTLTSPIGFTLFKIGNVKAGTLPTGPLGTLRAFGMDIVQVSLANTIIFTEVSCKTPSVNVDLGKQYSSKFGDIGSTIGKKAFDIVLSDCPTGLSGISYQLDPVNPAFDLKQGILALDEGGATGVGIQITDKNDTVVTLGEVHRFLETEPSGNYTIPLQAAYYKTADKVTPGKANASMQFTITYQ